jgi:methylenetetrahydrofolate--tRNA-(uracil-5-)-methyltransferase
VSQEDITVLGGGLAGAEAAFQLAARGLRVSLMEMRPVVPSPAHHGPGLAELVCSNSFKSDDPTTAAGMLKCEMESLGSLVLSCARATALPAGGALAVDREAFSALVTRVLTDSPNITIRRQEAVAVPDGDVIVATGPLSSSGLDAALTELVGDRLAFFDAAAPVLEAESIDRAVCFSASRYDKGGADYLNCPLDQEAYESLVRALVSAKRVEMRDFERHELFAACQPVEEIARCGPDALRYGALKPVGLVDPATDRRPWAVVQLRADNAAHSAYSLVGFQTNLVFAEQERVIRQLPGLEHAEFLRHGVMHRNTFVDAPRLLRPDLSLRTLPRVRIGGQLTGTEGYLEAAAAGLVAALGIVSERRGLEPPALPRVSALGSLIHYVTDTGSADQFQPMHVNFGLMPPLDPPVRSRKARREALAARGIEAMRRFVLDRQDLDVASVAREAQRVTEGDT